MAYRIITYKATELVENYKVPDSNRIILALLNKHRKSLDQIVENNIQRAKEFRPFILNTLKKLVDRILVKPHYIGGSYN